MSVETANAIEAKAAEWIAASCDTENWNETRQVELDTWLADSTANAVAYFRLLALWKSADRLAVLRRPMKETASVASQRSTFPHLRIAAAAFVIAAIGAGAFLYSAKPADRLYSTPVGGRETIVLADGTKIELNTNTALRARITPQKRAVVLLHGEAFFQVKHNATRPFTVESGGHLITDLGTKFLVRSDPGRVEVALIEGKAQFDFSSDEARTPPTVLVPGDVAVATPSSLSLTRKTQKGLAEETSWRRGVLVFDRASLADVAAEINRYSDKKLVVTDPAAARLTIGGTFPTGNVRTIAEAAQDFYGLNFVDRGDRIVISH